jgi:hypothetical protein
MAKSAKKPEPAAEQVFDVAISFLVADEKIASTIKSKVADLNVFFYPHNQEELIGTNLDFSYPYYSKACGGACKRDFGGDEK